MPTTRNIIIFTAIAAVFVMIYFFFIRSSPEQDNLVVSSSGELLPGINSGSQALNLGDDTSAIAGDFLNLLLNVKNIRLDDSILRDPSFNNLRDSSITLIPDGNEGRPNPFAQFGNDPVPEISITVPAVSFEEDPLENLTDELEAALLEITADDENFNNGI